VTALTQAAAGMTILDAKPIGTLPPAPGAAGNITAIGAASALITAAAATITAQTAQLTALKAVLK
jgi:hypothetical protein